MLLLRKTILLTVSAFYSIFGFTQGIITTDGSYLVVQDTGKIVVNNGQFRSNGSFTPGLGSLIFTGSCNTSQSAITGDGNISFYNLILNKVQNGMQLGRNIAVSNRVDLVSGDSLFLNTFNIDLGSTGLLRGEIANRHITGRTGGYIQSTQNLNAPDKFNPGNLGLEISSPNNLGTTLVRRGHLSQSDGFDIGISRYFDIFPTNNSSLEASLKFYYFDDELSSIMEDQLTSFISQDGGNNWFLSGYTTRNSTENYVETVGFTQLYRHTLASTEDPLPVKFLHINAERNGEQVLVDWAVAQKDANGEFQIQRSLNGQGFNTIGTIPVSGYSFSVRSYTWIDRSPQLGKNYYRIKQVDDRGEFSYSNVVRIIYDNGGLNKLLAFPNPVSSELTIRFGSDIEKSDILTILNFKGETISRQSIQQHKGINEISVDVATLPTGIYFIRINESSFSGTFIKQ